MTLEDILRDELRVNMTLHNQPNSIKICVALTTMMFVAGLVSSILAFVTFQNKECQQVGCGMYLLVSSVSSFLSTAMLIIQFWFITLTQINVSTGLSVLRRGCVSIEVILKLSLYFNGWLNACVAVERAVHVIKGVNFDKKKSKHYARRIIFILPFCIIGTLMHELLHRRLLVYSSKIEETSESPTERYVSCVSHYSSTVQDYNITILFFHLVGPFLINLCSALLIIFGAARRRSVSQIDKTFREHIREQFKEHKQLIIGPVILLVLSIPRLIISLLPDGVKVSENLWLYLSAYLISFIPSTLIFLIFVIPSKFYMKTFKQTFRGARQRNPVRQ